MLSVYARFVNTLTYKITRQSYAYERQYPIQSSPFFQNIIVHFIISVILIFPIADAVVVPTTLVISLYSLIYPLHKTQVDVNKNPGKSHAQRTL